MVSFRKSDAQSEHAVRKMDLDSQGTERNYQQALKGMAQYLKDEKLGDLRSLDKETAERYLVVRSQQVGQKTLDLDRQAIQAHLGQKLAVIKSEHAQVLESRAYTAEQVQLVAEAQTDRHSLATEIASNGGLRAHELLTLRPADEQPRDTHREYRDDLFAGREDVAIYTVTGKGGLCREVAIDREIADRLEKTRLDEPRQVYDRDIGYRQHYDIGGGKNWSDSFSRASDRALGWSNGAHGVRHEYAQDRMETLQSIGYSYDDALEVVSQEMGHFRPEITEVYLR